MKTRKQLLTRAITACLCLALSAFALFGIAGLIDNLAPNKLTPTALAAVSAAAPASGVPVVYMTTSITPEGLKAVYEALGVVPDAGDRVGIKVSTGDSPHTNYLRQDLIGAFVKSLNGTYIECNTAYGRRRGATATHYEVAKEHGFEPIVLIDEDGDMRIPIEGGTQIQTTIVGAKIADYNFQVVLSHFKGHAMAGFGGALKNLSIGYGSSAGKSLIHTGGESSTSMGGGDQTKFLNSMGDAAKGVVDYVKGLKPGKENIIFINVMNRLSVDCDCSQNPAQPDMHDIGILASTDPVALDKACLDLVFNAPDGASLIERIKSRDGIRTVVHAEEIGLGSQTYRMVGLGQ